MHRRTFTKKFFLIKQSSLLFFYAVPSSGELKGALVHWSSAYDKSKMLEHFPPKEAHER